MSGHAAAAAARGAAAHGYRVGDLVRHHRTAVCSAAGAHVQQQHHHARAQPQPLQSSDPREPDAGVSAAAWERAWERVRATVEVSRGSGMMEEIEAQVPWDELPGFREVRAALERVVLWPLQRKERFDALGIQPLGGVLLTGPTGYGKTVLAQVRRLP